MSSKRPRRAPRDPQPRPPGGPEGADQRADAPPAATTFNIVFVCTGNTCRSPMAEVIARDELARRGWPHVRVASAGVAAGVGAPASAEAVEVARGHGLDLSGHRSRRLSGELIDWADLILAMGHSHLPSIALSGGAEKSALLGDFAGGGTGGGVSDPYGGPVEVYERTFRELRELISSALDRLAPILAP